MPDRTLMSPRREVDNPFCRQAQHRSPPDMLDNDDPDGERVEDASRLTLRHLSSTGSARVSPRSRTWTASRATSSIASHNSLTSSQPLHGRRADSDEKHPGEVLHHMQQGRRRAHSLTPATA